MRRIGTRTAWGLIALGSLLIVEVLLAQQYHVSQQAAFGWKKASVLGVGLGLVCLGAFRVWRTWTGFPQPQDVARVRRFLAPFFVAFAIYFVGFLIIGPDLYGDQPHYGLEAISLAYDQDRDLSNDYTTPTRFGQVFGATVPDRHAYQYTKSPALTSVHSVGLPFLMAFGVPPMRMMVEVSYYKYLWPWRIEIILCAALAAQLLYRILRRLRPDAGPVLTRAVWASIAFSAPMMVFASEFYPEMPAVLLGLIAVDALLKSPTKRSIFGGAVAAALMPWLHVRFFPVAALLCLGLAARAVTATPGTSRPRALRDSAWALAPLLVSFVAMSLAFQHWYGSWLLNAQYRLPATRQPQTLEASYQTLAGGFWSSDRGLFPYVPIALFAVAAIPYAVRRYRRWALFGLFTVVTYLALLTIQGSEAGFSFPGRYLLLILPCAAIPLLILVADFPVARWVFWPLATVTLALSMAIVIEPPMSVIFPNTSGTLLWDWFIGKWPTLQPSPGVSYPDSSGILVLTGALLALCALVYVLTTRARTKAAAAA